MKKFWIILPVILISGLATPESSQAANRAGVWGVSASPANSDYAPQTIILPSGILAVNQNLSDLNLKSSLVLNNGSSWQDYLNQHYRSENNPSFQQIKAYGIVAQYLDQYVYPKLENKTARDAIWEEKDGKVVNFDPGSPGIYFNKLQITKMSVNKIARGQTEITLEPTVSLPGKKLSDINSYGIAELFASGTSNFAASSRNRTQNIRVGTAKYKGALIKPGEVFSFNSFLGEIDAKNGWAPELVIKKEGVVPEFGGGICQVSTTVFRAALNAGFEIVERKNHSFAVPYYAPQGTDATIYTGYLDLKFKNDSGNHILIWPEISGTTLAFNFYGKPDGRTVQVDDPVRYDIKGPGVFKTSLRRTVATSGGTQKEDIFRSSYRPRIEYTQTTTAQEPVAPPPTETPPNNNDSNTAPDNLSSQPDPNESGSIATPSSN